MAAGNIDADELEMLQVASTPEQVVEIVRACTSGTCGHPYHQRMPPAPAQPGVQRIAVIAFSRAAVSGAAAATRASTSSRSSTSY